MGIRLTKWFSHHILPLEARLISNFNSSGVHVNRVSAPPQLNEAVWDGRNFRNDNVGTGVYFIIGSDVIGKTFRDKLIVMRR